MENLLPKIAENLANGGLYHQAVKCGKPTCRCTHGHLHTGYYYLLTRINGRLKKLYVPKHLVLTIAALTSGAAAQRNEIRNVRRESASLLKEMGRRHQELF